LITARTSQKKIKVLNYLPGKSCLHHLVLAVIVITFFLLVPFVLLVRRFLQKSIKTIH